MVRGTRGTIAEEIIAAHLGRAAAPGEVVVVPVDACMATDGSAPLTIDLIQPYLGSGRRQSDELPPFPRPRAVFVKDHYVPCPNDKVARLHQQMDRFGQDQRVDVLAPGEGVCHRVLPENGLVLPGRIIAGADSHSTTYGALNAMGVGIGSTDLAGILLTGRMWMRVPETVGVRVDGHLPEGVYAKDLALFLVGEMGAGGANYRALEFFGAGLCCLGVEERFTICNMAAETGAKAALMPFDRATADWLERNATLEAGPLRPVENGPEDSYNRVEILHAARIEPMLAAPHSTGNVSPVRKWEGRPVHVAVIGTCVNGSLDDLMLASRMLGGRHVAAGVQLLVVPASRNVLLEATRQGAVAILVEAGALVLPPGCGPCCGALNGVPGDGQTVISTANRNFLGRMGNVKSDVFLASPATVVASAIEGTITDPRRYLT